jgi:hypothetical protein
MMTPAAIATLLGKAFHASNIQASDPLPNNHSRDGASCGKWHCVDTAVAVPARAA